MLLYIVALLDVSQEESVQDELEGNRKSWNGKQSLLLVQASLVVTSIDTSAMAGVNKQAPPRHIMARLRFPVSHE